MIATIIIQTINDDSHQKCLELVKKQTVSTTIFLVERENWVLTLNDVLMDIKDFKYVVFLDGSRDEPFPHMIECMVEHLEKSPPVFSGCYSDYYIDDFYCFLPSFDLSKKYLKITSVHKNSDNLLLDERSTKTIEQFWNNPKFLITHYPYPLYIFREKKE
ncbi:MAG: hypothetical protein SNJ64_01570 [Endomicrobiia bacterium]